MDGVARCADLRAQRGGIFLRYQPGDRHLHGIGVAHECRAIGVSALHRLGNDVQRLLAAELCKIVAFEDVEHLDQMNATGGGRRHRNNVIAAIGPADRLAQDRAVIFHVLGGHDPAGLAHGGDDLVRDRTFVKSFRPVAGNRPQRDRKVGLQQILARHQHGAVAVEKNRRARLPARDARLGQRQCIGNVVDDLHSVAGERDRRFDQFGERQFSGTVFFVRQRQTRDSARHADGQRRVARFFRIGFAVRVEKHFLGRGRRRGFAIVDRGIFARLAEVNDHEAAAADIAGARVSHRKRKADRNRRVDRVAAAIQNFNPDTGSALLLRDHHAVAGGDRLRRRDERGTRDRRHLRVSAGAEQQRDQQGYGASEHQGPSVVIPVAGTSGITDPSKAAEF